MHNIYKSPFSERYSSKEMNYIFSEEKKFKTWRKLWIVLAESEKELGLKISDEQINEMKLYQDTINYEDAIEREKIVKHDVMAHVYAYGKQCSKARGIIHLGATSCYVGDNTDIILMKEALLLVRKEVLKVIKVLRDFAIKYKDTPTLAFTHFQAAQPTTVGKRATLWIQDLLMDLENLDFQILRMKLLGSKGTTGTQASFKELFDNDIEKVRELDKKISEKLGFESCFSVSGQTYPRKLDSQIMFILNGIAQSATKFSNDIRLLQHLKEIEEPFGENQIGSSAMAYKRNPMKSERIASIARYVLVNTMNSSITASAQWFERTLDDSANKRIVIPECFLAIDAVLLLYYTVSSQLVVHTEIIKKHLMNEMPFIATENILMDAVKNSGDRQVLHEAIRVHSMETAKKVYIGEENDLLQRLASDPLFNTSFNELEKTISPEKYIGYAKEQTEEFIKQNVDIIGDLNKEDIYMDDSVKY